MSIVRSGNSKRPPSPGERSRRATIRPVSVRTLMPPMTWRGVASIARSKPAPGTTTSGPSIETIAVSGSASCASAGMTLASVMQTRPAIHRLDMKTPVRTEAGRPARGRLRAVGKLEMPPRTCKAARVPESALQKPFSGPLIHRQRARILRRVRSLRGPPSPSRHGEASSYVDF